MYRTRAPIHGILANSGAKGTHLKSQCGINPGHMSLLCQSGSFWMRSGCADGTVRP